VNSEFPRELTSHEAAVLRRLLSTDAPDSAALRAQADHVQAVGPCGCGCPSIDLEVDHEAASAASQTWRPFPVELSSAEEAPPLNVILFVDDGWLSYLELVYYESPPPADFPDPDAMRLS
jgi:hypothetical protein